MFIRPDLILQAMEKLKVIQERLKTRQSCEKSYIDFRRRSLQFEVKEWLYIKVSPMKGVMKHCNKGKLTPRYIGHNGISNRVCNVSYELELPKELAGVPLVFHISILKKFLCDPSLIIHT